MTITCLASTSEGNTYYFDIPPSKWKLPPGFMIKMARYPGEEAEVVAFDSIPEKTPEELAAEQREKDAEELAFIATGHRDRSKDCWISLAKVLIDAGYRKFEIVEEDV